MFRIIFIGFFFITSYSKCLDSGKVIRPDETEAQPEKTKDSESINGLSLVAPPRPFPNNPMTDIQTVNANWIAVIPYGFCRVGSKDIMFDMQGQWWGERKEGAKETIRLAKAAGIKVMLKPQIWVPGSWPGGITFSNESDWRKWEEAYRKFIMYYVELGKESDVEMICIGTEFKQSEVERESFWRDLIKEIRRSYNGRLTYASNWDSYTRLPFWDDLDYIGVDAYFPLDESKQPEKGTLMEKWKSYDRELKEMYRKFEKDILFTEFGYMAIEGCAGKTWELEPRSHTLPTNQKAQADALDALFDFFEDKEYWRGGFLWKWYPYPGAYQERGDKDYTPQGKKAVEVVKDWYGRL